MRGVALIGSCIMMALWVLLAVGWVTNIVFLVGNLGGACRLSVDCTLEIILRVAGIAVPPLGAIMGWFV